MIHKKRFVYNLLPALMCSCLYSCCDEPLSLSESSISLAVNEVSTGKFLFTVPYSFPIDTFKVVDEDMNLQEVRITNSEMIIHHFIDQEFHSAAFQEEVCRKYFLYFDHQNTDTLEVCVTGRQNRCGEEFSKVSLSYNSEEIFTCKDCFYIDAEVSR